MSSSTDHVTSPWCLKHDTNLSYWSLTSSLVSCLIYSGSISFQYCYLFYNRGENEDLHVLCQIKCFCQPVRKHWSSDGRRTLNTSGDIKATSLDLARCAEAKERLAERVSQLAALQDQILFYSVAFSTVGLSVITPVPLSPHYRIDLPLTQTAAISLL